MVRQVDWRGLEGNTRHDRIRNVAAMTFLDEDGTVSMKRKYIVWIGVLLIIAGSTACCFVISALPSPGVSLSNYHRIQIGQTESHVERILGESGTTIPWLSGRNGEECKQWGHDLIIYVWFDDAKRVRHKDIWSPAIRWWE